MKIESAKNNQADKKETRNVFKSEKSVFNTSNPLKSVETQPTTGAFQKILEETRREKQNSPAAKGDSAEGEAKAGKSESEEKLKSPADEKTEEKHEKQGDGDTGQSSDDSQSQQQLALASLIQQTNTGVEITAPPARAILHVADLERIVATIRTDTFQSQKQVTIALKNSILQGLQIKLTLAENGKVKAEFFAGSEQVQKQLKQRRKELAEILGNRSALFSDVEINSSPIN